MGAHESNVLKKSAEVQVQQILIDCKLTPEIKSIPVYLKWAKTNFELAQILLQVSSFYQNNDSIF